MHFFIWSFEISTNSLRILKQRFECMIRVVTILNSSFLQFNSVLVLRLIKLTDWPPIGKIAAHSANEMFSWYRCLIVSLVFSHLGFLELESFSDCAFS